MTARQPLSNLESLISRQWDEDIVAQLVEYVRIPAKSPHQSRRSASVMFERNGFAALAVEGFRREERRE
jgi:hypothetical protein